MSTKPLKGIEDLYECCCGGTFYEWIHPKSSSSTPLPVTEAQICTAPIWYNDAEALTLTEDRFDPWEEEKSTWRLTRFSAGKRDERLKHRPYKTFNLESDDDLVVVKCKIRPVIAIKEVSSDWRVPDNTANLYRTWLCLPIFRYKDRHTQRYVIRDQTLDRPHHFYFPPGLAGPGISEEGAGKFTEMQFIAEKNLTPAKSFCSAERMSLPFRLTGEAFQAVLGHIALFLPKIKVSTETLRWYDAFCELVRGEIDSVLAGGGEKA